MNPFDALFKPGSMTRVTVLCERHRGVETLLREGFDRLTDVPPCPLCKREKEDAEGAKKRDSERRAHLLHIAQIPGRFVDAGLRNFEDHCPEVAGVKSAVSGYVRSIADLPRQWKPLILSGVPGTGKTHLLCALANNLVHNGVGCHYTTVQTMLAEIKRAYNSDGLTEAGQVWRYVGNYSLLIIDEVDVMRASENDLGLIFAVINGRYNDMRSVAIGTNQSPDKLGEFLTERVADRLREGALTLRCDWKSRRAL